MADVLTRMRVDSSEYDQKIKRAQQNLLSFEQQCRATKQSMNTLSKENIEYVRSIGNMSTVSTNAKGKINELTGAFTELSLMYKRLSDEEKKGEVGKALTASLDQLKARITDTKAQLSDVTAELGETGQAGVDLKGVMDQLGGQLGINTGLIRGLSAGTIGATAAIGAMVTTTLAAAKAFADYNSELSMQGQVTTVTTGLQGPEADRMTDAARSISDVYGTDFREVINAANTLMTQFGETGDQAMQLIRDGMQGMIMGDGPKLLSMIQQYAPSFRDAGISASQLVAIIHNSEGGIFTDQNMNAIVMGIKNIRLMTNQTSEALGKMGIDGAEMTRKLNDGSMTIFEALGQVSDAIERTGSGSQAAGEVMQYVFGRQGAVAGTKLGEAIATLNTNLEETKNQTGELGQSYAQLEQANERLNTAIRDAFGYDGWQTMATGIKTELVGALSGVLTLVGELKESVVGDIAGTIFDAMTKGIQTTIMAGRTLLSILNNITGYKPTGTAGSGGDAGKALLGALPSDQPGAVNPTGNVVNPPKDPQRPLTQQASPRQQAAKSVDAAMQKYNDAIALATKEMEAGVTTEAEYKKRLLSGQQRLYDAYGQAYQTYADPAYKEAQKRAADEVVRLGGEIKGLTEAQEASKKAARELEQAQQKLADAEKRLADAQASGSATAVYKAQQDVDRQRTAVTVASGNIPTGYQATLTINADTKEAMDAVQRIEGLVIDPKTLTVTASTQEAMDALREVDGVIIDPKTVKITAVSDDTMQTMFDGLKQSVQAEIKFDQMSADEATLRTLLKTALQNGLDSVTVDYGALQQRIVQGIDIPDEDWQALVDEINAKLAELGIDPIAVNFDTGKLTSDAKKMSEQWADAGNAIRAVGSAMSAIEDPAAKVMSTIAQAIATIALSYAEAMDMAAKNPANAGWGWIAFAATGLATMLTSISAVKSATAGSYAQGGIVPGNSFSGDRLTANVNSGELILSRSQQDSIAAQLSSGDGDDSIAVQPYVMGEQIFLGMNNTSRRMGRGEIVTTSTLRRYGLIK